MAHLERLTPLSQRLPLAVPACSFAGGIVLWSLCSSMWIAAVSVILSIVFFLLRRPVAAIGVCAAVLGFVDVSVTAPGELPEGLDNRDVTISAIVEETKESEAGSQIIFCKADSIDRQAVDALGISVNYVTLEPRIDPGQRICFRAELHPLTRNTDLPDEIILSDKRCLASATVAPDEMVSVCGKPSLMYRWRKSLERQLAKIPFDSETHTFLDAVLLGESDSVSRDMRLSFSSVGTAHILALSGMHVGIIAMLLMWMLYPLTFYGLHRTRLLIVMAALWGFALITGLSTSVTRAVIMATVVLAGRLLQRRTEPLNGLFLAALIILLADPGSLFAPGFQLSFSAAGAILAVLPAITVRGPLRGIVTYLAATGAAMATAGILSVFYFHIFPVYFLLGNLLTTLLLPPLIMYALVCLAIACLFPLPGWAAWPGDFLYRLIADGTGFISSLPGSSIDNLYFTPWALLPFGLALLLVFASIHRGKPLYLAGTAALLVSSVALAIALEPEFPANEMYITRHRHHTTLVVRDGESLWLVTTAPTHEREAVTADAEFRYSDYRRRRGLGAFVIAPDTVQGQWFRRRGPVMEAGENRIAIIASSEDLEGAEAPVDSMILARGFRDDAVEAAKRLSPKKAIISADMNRRRALRYCAELTAAGVDAEILR